MTINAEIIAASKQICKKNQKGINAYFKDLNRMKVRHYQAYYTDKSEFRLNQLLSINALLINAYNSLSVVYARNPQYQEQMDSFSHNLFKNNFGKSLHQDISVVVNTSSSASRNSDQNSSLKFSLFLSDTLQSFIFPEISDCSFPLLNYHTLKLTVDFHLNHRENEKIIIKNQKTPLTHQDDINFEKFITTLVPDALNIENAEFTPQLMNILYDIAFNTTSADMHKVLTKSRPEFILNLVKDLSTTNLYPVLNDFFFVFLSHLCSSTYKGNARRFNEDSYNDSIFQDFQKPFMKVLDTNNITQLIDLLATTQTQVGYFKDLDTFNFDALIVIEDFFNKIIDKVSKEDISKLRILRNIAKDKNIEFEFFDDRAYINSVSEKPVLIFGDKVNCEATIIDLQILSSRFKNSPSISMLYQYLDNLLDFSKQNNIFSSYSITIGKRKFSHIATVLFYKGKKFNDESFSDLGQCFEAAMIKSQESVDNSWFIFPGLLESCYKEQQLLRKIDNNTPENLAHKAYHKEKI